MKISRALSVAIAACLACAPVSSSTFASRSHAVGGSTLVGSDFTLEDSLLSCDHDGVLDVGERGRFQFRIRNTGTETANNVTVRLQGMHWNESSVTSVHFDSIGAGEEVQPSFELELAHDATSTWSVIDVRVDADGALSSTTFGALVQSDVIPASSTSDDFADQAIEWILTEDPALHSGALPTWSRGKDPFLSLPDQRVVGDLYAISPALEVSSDTPFSMTFRTWFNLDADPPNATDRQFRDGARLELSTDDGATWTDIGDQAQPAYDGVITAATSPLKGLRAWSGTSPGFPSFANVSVDLGTAYAGQTVRVRFRLGLAGAGLGEWAVDDVAFSGLTNLPFASVVADRKLCVNVPPLVDAGATQSVAAAQSVRLKGTASDSDGDTLTFSWRQHAGTNVELEDADTLTPSFVAPSEFWNSVLTFELTATDSAGHSVSDQVEVDVAAVVIDTKPRPSPSPTPAPSTKKSGCQTADSVVAFALLGLLVRRRISAS